MFLNCLTKIIELISNLRRIIKLKINKKFFMFKNLVLKAFKEKYKKNKFI